ncbi:MAG: pitrilysin family protein [Planctomycetota bacterium]
MSIFEKTEITDGISLYLYPTDKFKTTLIRLYWHFPLDEKVTANALLARVLARGCKKYPNMRKISRFLESRYDAGFSIEVDKIGERHLVQFDFSFIAKRFLPGRTNNLADGFEFLRKIIAEPLLEKNGVLGGKSFKMEYFQQEQQNLKNLIQSLVDDKIAYAQERCIQEMCHNEPFRIYEYGEIPAISRLTSGGLTQYLWEVLGSVPMDIFVVGQFRPAEVKKIAAGIFSKPPFAERRNRKRSDLLKIPAAQINYQVLTERKVQETQNLEQGKLVLGYRTGTTWKDNDIFALLVFNGIFGAFPHSKIFQNVREKNGLAYYAGSQLEKTKGLMIVNAGINPNQYEPAVRIIQEQLTQITGGHISDQEFEATIKGLTDKLKSIQDNPGALMDYYLEQNINGRNESFESLQRQISSVTKKDVMNVAQRIKLDTVYFLAPTGLSAGL